MILPIKLFYSNKIVDSSKQAVYLDDDFKKPKIIKQFGSNKNFDALYTIDWNFFAPSLTQKHREKIKEIFIPKKDILMKVEKTINDLRSKYDYIIGLHLRFKEPGDGDINDPDFLWYVENKHLSYIKGFLEMIIKFKNLEKENTGIIVASNSKSLDLNCFSGFNIFYERKNMVEDLFLLSKCNIILGCKSSFCSFASFIGNILLFFIPKASGNLLSSLNNPQPIIWRLENN